MRILQIIDTLETGGAERMAVNYANAILEHENFSALITTREEGILKKNLNKKVVYTCLNKKNSIDIKAIYSIITFIKKNKIEVLHAHSSSYFLATICKIFIPKIKIIWHDHYGNSEFLNQRPQTKIIKICSYLFHTIISVNQALEHWAKENLHCKNVYYLPNFGDNSISINPEHTLLKGQKGKRIICLANLRPQKNHTLLLDVALELKNTHPDWTFHLVGKDFKDFYSENLIENIKKKNLQNNVYLYDSREDISNILANCDIGILTSKSEGLPVAIIEYGLNNLPVIATNVGDINKVIINGETGYLVNNLDPKSFSDQLKILINSTEIRDTLSKNLNLHIKEKFSKDAVLKNYLNILEE